MGIILLVVSSPISWLFFLNENQIDQGRKYFLDQNAYYNY